MLNSSECSKYTAINAGIQMLFYLSNPSSGGSFRGLASYRGHAVGK